MLSGFDQVEPFQVRALPLLSTAIQNIADGQDTDNSPPLFGSMLSGFDQVEPFQVMTFPRKSTAAQKLAEGHDME
jgi:hypothetical protein